MADNPRNSWYLVIIMSNIIWDSLYFWYDDHQVLGIQMALWHDDHQILDLLLVWEDKRPSDIMRLPRKQSNDSLIFLIRTDMCFKRDKKRKRKIHDLCWQILIFDKESWFLIEQSWLIHEHHDFSWRNNISSLKNHGFSVKNHAMFINNHDLSMKKSRFLIKKHETSLDVKQKNGFEKRWLFLH